MRADFLKIEINMSLINVVTLVSEGGFMLQQGTGQQVLG